MPPPINGGVNSRAPRPSGLGGGGSARVPARDSLQGPCAFPTFKSAPHPLQFLIRQRKKKTKQTGKLSNLLFLQVGVPGGIYKYLKFSPAV